MGEEHKGSFEAFLRESIDHFDLPMLVVISDDSRAIIFRECSEHFDEPALEKSIVATSYETFKEADDLHLGNSRSLTMVYDAMQVIQFKVDSFYGTIIGDILINTAQLHTFVGQIRGSLLKLSSIYSELNENTDQAIVPQQ